MRAQDQAERTQIRLIPDREKVGTMHIGRMNEAEVLKRVDFGVYLDGGELGEVLLPLREVPSECQPGDRLQVFVYRDSEDRPIATTKRPLAQVGDLARLRVVDVNPVGAFLDWGLPKDLLVPLNEQQETMRNGRRYLVYVALDRNSRRVYASSKLEQFFSARQVDVQERERVDLLVAGRSPLGYKVIVNRTSCGMLYDTEVYEQLEIGREMPGYVKTLRPDGKIDLSLQKPGYDKVLEAKENIIRLLKEREGFLKVTDKSPAADIHELFGISKKTFKQAVGALYKARRIRLDPRGLALITEGEDSSTRTSAVS